jgi:uncharacterized Zn-binding protein involved in type VI secretion
MVTPGTPPIPHVGGPIIMGYPTVMIGFMPAARVSDTAVCVGPPDVIVKGSPTVIIGGLLAARIGDTTAHGGSIVMGCPTVMIGDVGMGCPSSPVVSVAAPPASALGPLQPAPDSAPPGQSGGAGSSSGGGSPSGSGAGGGAQSGSAAGAGQGAGQKQQTPPEKTWISILLKDFEGTPLPDQNFRIALEGGQVLSGRTDSQGRARFEGVEPDSGQVHFVDIPEKDGYEGSAAGTAAGGAAQDGHAVSAANYEIPDDELLPAEAPPEDAWSDEEDEEE